jgi:PAS domain S-box-containing protein
MPYYTSTFALSQQLGVASTYLVLALLCLCLAAYLHLRRSYELVLRAKQEWMGTVDSMEDLIFSHDHEGQLLRVNRRLADRLGVAPINLVGQKISEAFPNAPTNQACPYCQYLPIGRTEGLDPCFGFRAVVSTSPLARAHKENGGVVHVVRDVTAQLAAEERYGRLFHGLREAVFVTAPDGTILECNQALVTMLGYESREDLLKVNARELYATAGTGRQRDAIEHEMEQVGYVHNHELTLQKKDGTPIIALETSFATRDPQGSVISYQGFLLDITQSKQAQEEIRRKNRELNALNTMAGLTNRTLDVDEVLNASLRHVIELFGADAGSAYVWDDEQRMLNCRAVAGHTKQAVRFLSEVPLTEELLRQLRERKLEIVAMDDAAAPPMLRELLQREGIASGLGVVLWSRSEMNGWIGVSWRAPRVFTLAERELMAAIGRQIATSVENARLYQRACLALEDLQHAQEQLLQSEKMSAVGQLISGVAHELNNPLTAILGYTQLMESEPLNDRSRDFLQKIFRQAQRTHRVVQNLLSFARQRQPRKEQVDLRRVLDETLLLRDYDLRVNNIVVERNFTPELPSVVADQHQLEQVFLNIINNAVDAILETGKGGALRVSCFAENGTVVAEFHDSGAGLQDAKRIFDPFYTTKQVGKGTGLGLSICYGIIKEHGGEVTASNHEQGGAVFQVRLPAVRKRSATPGPFKVRVQPLETVVLNCRILLVDDEDSVLEFEREVLAGAGANVLTLSNGDEAIEQIQRHSFDVMIFDGKMPGRYNGIELCRWLGDHRPDLLRRVVLTVSNATDPAVAECIATFAVHCLTKPFQVADLFAACHKVLETKPTALLPA